MHDCQNLYCVGHKAKMFKKNIAYIYYGDVALDNM